MSSLSNRIPKPPFFFRIFSSDGQGIMYKAVTKIDQDAYECPVQDKSAQQTTA